MSTTSAESAAANHYQLLRLKPFENDQAVIRSHFRQLAAQVRTKMTAEPGVAKWPAMLDAMTRAMLVLADVRLKADYDASLGNKSAHDVRATPLEKLLVRNKVLDATSLEKAQKFADTVNLGLHEAVIQQKLAAPDVVMPLYAESLGLPFLPLADAAIDESLIATIPAVMARQNSLTPVLRDGGRVVIASPSPLRAEIEEQLQLRFSAQVRQVICMKAAVDEAIAKYYPREAAVAQMSTVPQAASKTSSGGAAGGGTPTLNRAELRKKKLKIGFVCGAFTMMVVIFGCAMFTQLLMTDAVMMYAVGLGAGAVAFAVGFLVVNE